MAARRPTLLVVMTMLPVLLLPLVVAPVALGVAAAVACTLPVAAAAAVAVASTAIATVMMGIGLLLLLRRPSLHWAGRQPTTAQAHQQQALLLLGGWCGWWRGRRGAKHWAVRHAHAGTHTHRA